MCVGETVMLMDGGLRFKGLFTVRLKAAGGDEALDVSFGEFH